MQTLTESPDDIADREAGDLNLALTTPPRRRHKSRAGKTAALSPRRKAEFVLQAMLCGRADSATARACLDGLDGAEVIWRIWRRAQKNPRLALLLTDAQKCTAMMYQAGEKVNL